MNTCFIRRSQQHWTAARPHHHQAFQRYLTYLRTEGREGEPGEEEEEEEEEGEEEGELSIIPNGEAVIISVPHTDGGTFVASFSHIEDDLYQFVDAYRNTVQIMLSTLWNVALINRQMD